MNKLPKKAEQKSLLILEAANRFKGKAVSVIEDTPEQRLQVVDSLADIFVIIIVMDSLLSDGLQIVQDAVGAIRLQPEVVEIVTEVKMFADGLVNVSPAFLPFAVLKARDEALIRIKGKDVEVGLVSDLILKGIYNAANNQYLLREMWGQIQAQIQDWKMIKDPNFPLPETPDNPPPLQSGEAV